MKAPLTTQIPIQTTVRARHYRKCQGSSKRRQQIDSQRLSLAWLLMVLPFAQSPETSLSEIWYRDAVRFEAVDELNTALTKIRITIEALSRRDATLATADAAIYFMLRKLQGQHSEISLSLLKNLKLRADERVNIDIMRLLNSLKDPSIAPSKVETDDNSRAKLDEATISITTGEHHHEQEIEDGSPQVEKSLEDELNEAIKDASVEPEETEDGFKALKSEFVLFRNADIH